MMSRPRDSNGSGSGIFGSLASWWGTSSSDKLPPPVALPVETPPVVSNDNTPKLVQKDKLTRFAEVLLSPKINLRELQDLCTYGIPDKLRPNCWLILLGVLPLSTSLWKSEIQKNLDLWKEFVKELVVNPREEYTKSQSANDSESVSLNPLEDDHPLSQSKTSKWNAYFKDCELQAEIKKDVNRTFPTLHFFRQGREEHLESLEKILFIWCKLNPGVSYVQGMNEVLGPIYYIFAADPERNSDRNLVESFAFFCFTNLMSEIMNNFIKTLDSSEHGIKYQIAQLQTLLEEKDPQLWKSLLSKKLDPQFFAFRQMTLLLSQEFELPDVLRLWDTLFSDANRFELLRYTCCAMLILQREDLLRGDFSHNLKLLQSYPPSDMEEIIATALDLASNPEYQPPFTDDISIGSDLQLPNDM